MTGTVEDEDVEYLLGEQADLAVKAQKENEENWEDE